MDNTPVVIDNITIRQDMYGRYCLNDLHQAAGGDPKHQPALFFRLDSTEALIDEVLNSTDMQSFTPINKVMGRNGGTYVVKELVYAYAMWISPGFHLKVIRAYDRLQTQGVAIADHAAEDLLKNPLKYLEVLLSQAKELQARNLIAEPKAAVFDSVVADRRVSLRDFARRLDNTEAWIDEVLNSTDMQSFTPINKVMGRNGGS